MLTFNLYLDMSIYLFTYLFIYNLSVTLLFWSLFNILLNNFKTLYFFANFSFNWYLIGTLTILILSMAGVPPFIGFFSKLFILVFILNNSFFLVYLPLIVILLLGLYFYVQNLRFLHSTGTTQVIDTNYINNEFSNYFYYHISILLILFTVFGVFIVDDILLLFMWILY